jgi:signal transduction histidine kinase
MKNRTKDTEIFLDVFGRVSDNSQEKLEFDFVLNDVTDLAEKQKSFYEYRYKTTLLSKIAHEFKNPLISINELTLQIAEKTRQHGAIDKKKVYKVLTEINSISNFLILLVKDLDSFSKVEFEYSDKMVENKIFQLESTLSVLKSISKSLIKRQNKQINLKINLIKEFPRNFCIFSNECKLLQILVNLVSNSIKFTNIGTITIKASLETTNKINNIKFDVYDTGSGMSEEMQKNIFLPFKKGHYSNNEIGSGLGLYIVQNLIVDLKSQIFFKSEEQVGSKFWFTIPVDIEESQSFKIETNIETQYVEYGSELSTKKQDYNPNNLRLYLSDFQEENKSLMKSSFQNSEKSIEKSIHSHNKLNNNNSILKIENNIEHLLPIDESKIIFLKYKFSTKKDNLNILIVDDDELVRQSNLRIIKSAANHMNIEINIIEACDGVECLLVVWQCFSNGIKLSMIFSDETMQYLNGSHTYDIIEKFSFKNNIPIPFILVTAYNDLFSKSTRFQVISKPLTEDKVNEYLKRYIV